MEAVALVLRYWKLALWAATAGGLVAFYEGVPFVYQGKIDRVCGERMAFASSVERERQAIIAEMEYKKAEEVARRLEAEKAARLRLQEELDNEARNDPDAASCGVNVDGVRRIQRSGR